MKTKKLEVEFEKLSNDEMLKIAGGTGLTKVIIIINGVPTVYWI
jgi:hypothetical protein